MLGQPLTTHRPGALRARQSGVVLMIALIILVALTIGGIALVRSVDTTNLISGNLAFQQAATRSGEAGTEDAIRTVIEAGTFLSLQSDDLTRGYVASSPVAGLATPAEWNTFWSTRLPATLPVTVKACANRVCNLPTDVAGNTVSYAVQRLCLTSGIPGDTPSGCSVYSQKTPKSGDEKGAGGTEVGAQDQYLYRITTRVTGPRNTVSYIQTIVAR